MTNIAKKEYAVKALRPLVVLFIITIFTSSMVIADSSSLTDGVRLAADHHLALESSYANGDTSVGNYDCAWQWFIGPGQAAYMNTQGPSALGLLASYEALGKVKYLNGAVCAGNQMVARYDTNTTKRPYAQDIEFLVQLSKFTKNKIYKQKAALYHVRTRTAYPTGALLADYYISGRMSLAGWDLAAQIRAAAAVEQDDYAKQIAIQVISHRSDWEGVLYNGSYDYTLIGHADLLSALDDMKDPAVKVYRKEIEESVLAAQDPDDGSWGDGDYQTTAFALMGLESLSRSHDVRQAIKGGMNFLLSTETAEGGWLYSGDGEYGEVNGEVLSALGPLMRNKGDDDEDEQVRGPKEHPDRDRGHARVRRGEHDDR